MAKQSEVVKWVTAKQQPVLSKRVGKTEYAVQVQRVVLGQKTARTKRAVQCKISRLREWAVEDQNTAFAERVSNAKNTVDQKRDLKD